MNNVDNTKKPEVTCVELCAGYCGIHLGLKRAIPNLRTVALCEIEAYACANLVQKMEQGLLEPAPIWTDLKTFPWEEFSDRVDILVGGYPCQPFSSAGKRLGKDDPRHLWPWIADGIRLLRPRACFFENVEGHVSMGLSSVVSDLEELGYKVSWGIFSASEVGAPHRRKRVFILGELANSGFNAGCSELRQAELPEELSRGDGLADNHGEREQKCRAGSGGSQHDPARHHGWPSRPGQPQFDWEPPRVI